VINVLHESDGNGNELMGMGGNGNAASHSRISLIVTKGVDAIYELVAEHTEY